MKSESVKQRLLFSDDGAVVWTQRETRTVRRAYKYRLWTNANQERELTSLLETHRRLYNSALQDRIAAYEAENRRITYNQQTGQFIRDRKTNPFYAKVNVSTGYYTLMRLDRAFQSFFRRIRNGEKAGHPRFKSKDRFHSFMFRIRPEGRADGAKLIGGHLRIQNVGNVKVNLHRPLEGRVKAATVQREADKWYVIFSCEVEVQIPRPSNAIAVGIDVGLTHFLTTSDGVKEKNQRYLKHALPELRRAGRDVARKKKGGSNRRKAVKHLQTIHAKVKNQRREHHYQVACRLVLAYGLIAAESLNIQGMIRSGRFSRAIGDVAWAAFLNRLRCKAESAGVEYVEVDPRGTSQECSGCHQEVRKDLSVRWHNCPHCGLSLDRDHNAARNILARGLARAGPAGLNVTPEGKRVPRSRRKTE